MLVLPKQGVIVVATPRTGSRAMDAAIIAQEKRYSITKQHHDFPHEISKVVEGTGYEVWTLIREPISQLKSWISHCQFWNDPTEFIETYHSRYFMYEGGMNIYNQIADRYFVYENGGIFRMLEALGLRRDGVVEVIGETGSKDKELSPKQVGLALKRFVQDFELYEKVCNTDSRGVV